MKSIGQVARLPTAYIADGVFSKLDADGLGYITLPQFVSYFHPNLSSAEVQHCIELYTPPDPPSSPLRTLQDVPGADDEIRAIFKHWAHKYGDGHAVKWSDLSSPLERCGITQAFGTPEPIHTHVLTCTSSAASCAVLLYSPGLCVVLLCV